MIKINVEMQADSIEEAMTAASQLAYTLQTGQDMPVVILFSYGDEVYSAGYNSGEGGWATTSGGVKYTRLHLQRAWGRIVKPGDDR